MSSKVEGKKVSESLEGKLCGKNFSDFKICDFSLSKLRFTHISYKQNLEMKRKEIMDLAPSENQSEDQIKTEKPETPVSCKNV